MQVRISIYFQCFFAILFTGIYPPLHQRFKLSGTSARSDAITLLSISISSAITVVRDDHSYAENVLSGWLLMTLGIAILALLPYGVRWDILRSSEVQIPAAVDAHRWLIRSKQRLHKPSPP